jgi:hypothetical protein
MNVTHLALSERHSKKNCVHAWNKHEVETRYEGVCLQSWETNLRISDVWVLRIMITLHRFQLLEMYMLGTKMYRQVVSH